MGKYFGTDGFRGEANVKLTADHAFRVGRYLGWYFGQDHKARIVIGKDTRRSSYMFEYALAAGLTASGADAYLLHVTTTPSVSYVVRTEDFDCGIMISASHNPFYDNGIKVINSAGHKLEAEVEEKIEAYIDGEIGELPLATKEKIGRTVDYAAGRNRYIGHLISVATRSFKDMRVGLDCSNGSSSAIAKSVFDALGAKTYVINNEPDGTNINTDCGSTHIHVLQEFVKEKKLDVGFAYDGDADRCIAVDENGKVTGVAPGDVTIYAYTHDHSGIIGEINLRILPYIPVEDITISPYEDKLYMYEEITLDYAFTPASATASTVEWSSSDESVVTVEQGKVTAVGFGTAVVTARCILNDKSSSVTITVEAGAWIWDERNNFKNWVISQNYSSFVIQDGKMVVTCGQQNTEMKRADLRLTASEKAPVYMHWGNYPVIALRTDLPGGGKGVGKGGVYTLNIVPVSGSGTSKAENNGILLADGTRMLYWDVSTLGNISTTEMIPYKTFEVKVADIYNQNLPTGKYTVYWIRTFKSVAEAEAFAKADVEAGN